MPDTTSVPYRWWFRGWTGAMLTGLLLAFAWPVSGFTGLMFIAWVPLLLSMKYSQSAAVYFWQAWLAMLLWNLLTTWWVWNASPAGAVGAIVANSLLMVFPLMLQRWAYRIGGAMAGAGMLLVSWLAWEYLHFRWELSWPWLTLGHVFSAQPSWVYWYSVTGVAGGTLWILVINLLVAQSISHQSSSKSLYRRYALPLLLIVLPILLSFWMKPDNEIGKPTEVVVVQPNVEAYEEKFNTPPAQLVSRMLAQTNSAITKSTLLVVWPETAVPAQTWENELTSHPDMQPLLQWTTTNPGIALLTGTDTYRYYPEDSVPNRFSIRRRPTGTAYEAFNTALQLQAGSPPQLYHKSKLVPGVETLPSWLSFLGSLFDSFGGISGTLGRNDSAMVFEHQQLRIAPVICYESIYGDYLTDYVRRGANLIAVITNDGWWGNTPGYKQHMQYARLRAIESHRWVLRSANTGISCFIAPDGTILQPQPWNTAAAIRQTVYLNNEQTLYVRLGPWLSHAALVIFGLLVVWLMVQRLRRKP